MMSPPPCFVFLISLSYWMKPLRSFLATLKLLVWINISTRFHPPLAHFSSQQTCGWLCICVWVTVYYLQRVWLSWRWEGCVVAVAAWSNSSSSSSTGNASKRWELTGTRCLRLPAGGFSPWNKSVSGGSSLPPDCLAVFSVCLYLWIFCLWVISFFLAVKTTWCIRWMRLRQLKDTAAGDE